MGWGWNLFRVAGGIVTGAIAAIAAPVSLGVVGLTALGAGVGAGFSILLGDEKSEEEIRKEREERIQKEKEELKKKDRKDLLDSLEAINAELDLLEDIIKKAERNDIPEDKQLESYQEFRRVLADIRIKLIALREADISSEKIPDKSQFDLVLDLLEQRATRVSEKFRYSVEEDLKKTTEDCVADYNKANQILVRENEGLKADLPPELKSIVAIANNLIPQEHKEEVEKLQTLTDKIADLRTGLRGSLAKGEHSLNTNDETGYYQQSQDMFDKRREIGRLQKELLDYLRVCKIPLPPTVIKTIISSVSSYELNRTVVDFYKKCLEKHSQSIKVDKHKDINAKLSAFMDMLQRHKSDYDNAIEQGRYSEAHDIVLRAYDLAAAIESLASGRELKTVWGKVSYYTARTWLGSLCHSVSSQMRAKLRESLGWLGGCVPRALIDRESRFANSMSVAARVMSHTAINAKRAYTACDRLRSIKEQEVRDEREREAEAQRQREAEAQRQKEAEEKARLEAEDARIKAEEAQRQKEAEWAESIKRAKEEAEKQKLADEQDKKQAEENERNIEPEAKQRKAPFEGFKKWSEAQRQREAVAQRQRELGAEQRNVSNQLEDFKKWVEENLKPNEDQKQSETQTADVGLDLPSVPTTLAIKDVTPSTSGLVDREDGKEQKADLPSGRKVLDTQKRVGESHPLAEAAGVGESVFHGVREDEDKKRAKELLKSQRVEEELEQRRALIEHACRQSREAFKVWANLSDAELEKKFGFFATLFFSSLSRIPLRNSKFSKSQGYGRGVKHRFRILSYLCVSASMERFRITNHRRCTTRN